MISSRRFRWILGALLLMAFPELFYLHRRLVNSRYEQNVDISISSEWKNDTYGDSSTFSDLFLGDDDGGKQQADEISILSVTRDENTENFGIAPSRSHEANTVLERTQYLFPVHFWEGGPNWNYLSFRRDIAYALTHNRTLVMIPFHNHHILGWERGWRSFKNTFDVDKLRELVRLVSPQTYKEDCNASMELLIQFTLSQRNTVMRKHHREQYERTRTDFLDLWGIHLPDTSQKRRNKTELDKQIRSAENVPCLGINGPLQVNDLQIPNEDEVLRVVDMYFKPAEYIRRLALLVKKNICSGKPFVAIHWRNRTGEACEFGMVLNAADACPQTMPLLTNASDRTAEAVSQLMRRRDIYCVYVAAPPRHQAFIDRLKDKVSHVYTADDIVSLDSKVLQHLKKDNYKLSLVEQEFCAKADIFLSCGRSNWSDFVRNRRDIHGKDTSYLRDLPGIPEEIYNLI
ncbi:uncharacterized protein LOC144449771 [Glandiceps talaboti]